MPPGHYTLELLSDRFLCFTASRTGKRLAVIMVQPDPVPYIETFGAVRFIVSGYRHYLTEIRFANSGIHSLPVLPHSLERELATNPSCFHHRDRDEVMPIFCPRPIAYTVGRG